MTVGKMLRLALCALALVGCVLGHGGGLHDWTFLPAPTPPEKDFIRYEIASCSSWVPLSFASLNLGPLPVFPPAATRLSAADSASIFYYLDGNCTDRATTSIDISVNLTLDGQTPYAGKQVNGYGFVGNCSNPRDLYRNNASAGDDRFNLVWWRRENSNTTDDGTIFGAAPNVMISRAPPAADALRSIVLYPSPADSEPLCCNLAYNAPPPADFFTQGSFCTKPAPPPPAPPSPPPPSPLPSPPPPKPRSSPSKAPPPRRKLV